MSNPDPPDAKATDAAKRRERRALIIAAITLCVVLGIGALRQLWQPF